MTSENLLTVNEAAGFLNISTVTLGRKIRNKEIGSFKIGRRVLLSKEEHLAPFLEKCNQPPKEDAAK